MILQVSDDGGDIQSTVQIDDSFWTAQKTQLQLRLVSARPGWLLEPCNDPTAEAERSIGSDLASFDTWIDSLGDD
jgi:hypothetical protein